MNDFEDIAAKLRERWQQGAVEYGDKSFAKPIRTTMAEVLEEQIDVVGWLFVAWYQAAIKAGTRWHRRDAEAQFLWNLRNRVQRRDRRTPQEGLIGLQNAMAEIEVVAMDYVLGYWDLERRLRVIERAIQNADVERLGRRNSPVTDRSSD